MRTLVTGGAGFIGSNLVDRLLVEGHEVDVVDDFSTGSLSNLAEARGSAGRALTIHHLDISAPAVIELMARRRPELVFHLAAQADVRVSVARPAFDATVNIVGSLNVLEGARQAEAERVVFAASGGTLYGEPADEDLPVRESHPQQPLSPYGVSKKAVIDYLVAYRELHSLEFCALALGNVYGPRQNPHGEAGVVAIFADRVLRGEPVTIFGDGEQTRDFVFVDDVVDAFVRAATRGGGLVCNIGTGRETSVNELVAAHGVPIWRRGEVRLRPAAPGRAPPFGLDVERAAIQLGWRSWTSWTTGCAPCSSSCAPAPRTDFSERGPRPGGRITSARTEAGRSHSGGTPRTTATGTPRSLPITSSAADANSSATQISVATSSRPPASAVPFRSTTAATPAQPMATSVTPRRQGRPKVSETITPELETRVRSPARPGCDGPSGPSPRGAARPSRPPRWRGRRPRWRR